MAHYHTVIIKKPQPRTTPSVISRGGGGSRTSAPAVAAPGTTLTDAQRRANITRALESARQAAAGKKVPKYAIAKTQAAQREAAQRSSSVIKSSQRTVAKAKIGTITRTTTDPVTKTVTYHGVKKGDKYTFPIGQLAFKTKESRKFVLAEKGKTRVITELQFKKEFQKEATARIQKTLDRKIAVRDYQRIAQGKERPAQKVARLKALLMQQDIDIKNITPFQEKVLKDITKLEKLAGKEAGLAQYVVTPFKYKGKTTFPGTQIDKSISDIQQKIGISRASGTITATYKEPEKVTGMWVPGGISYGGIFQKGKPLSKEEFEKQVKSGVEVTGYVDRPGLLETASRALSKKTRKFETAALRRNKLLTHFGLAGLGLGSSVLGTVRFIAGAVTRPRETISSTYKGGKEVIQRLTTGEGFPEIGQALREKPAYVAGYVGGELLQFKASGIVLKRVGTGAELVRATRSSVFKPVKVTALGEKVIKKIPKELGKGTFDLGLIPGSSPKKIPVNVKRFIKEVVDDIPLRRKPLIPKVNPIQDKILRAVAKEGDAVTGSFAQKTLITKSRGFADIDIVAKDVNKLASTIKKSLGNKVIIKTVDITDSPLGKFKIKRVYDSKTGKLIADLDPIKFAEEGLVKKYPTIDVDGIKFVDLKSRLEAKTIQLARGKKVDKVITDIDLITGGTQDVARRAKSPLLRGAFGYSRREQLAYTGKKGIVTTSARDLFKMTLGPEDVKVSELGLWGTPSDPITGTALARTTRLGLKQRTATIGDILSGDITFKRTKPQIVTFQDQIIGKDFKLLTPGSSELEVFLKGGNIIKRGPIIAETIIDGRRVPVITSSIGQPSKELAILLRKTNLKPKEVAKLRNLASKETGFDLFTEFKARRITGTKGISSLGVATKPYISPLQIPGPTVLTGKTLKMFDTKPITDKSISPGFKFPSLDKKFKISIAPTVPISKLKSLGLVSTGVPSPGVPSPGISSLGFPSPDIPSPDIPSPDIPSPDVPSPDVPSPDLPSPGVPSPGLPTPKIITPKVPKPIIPKIILPTDERERKKSPGFYAMIKKKQRKIKKGTYRPTGWKKANTMPLTKLGAKVLGSELVDKYTQRSFKVKPANTHARGAYKDSLWGSHYQARNRMSKKDSSIYVEKSKYAIDSKEELQGIPYKGQEILRSMRKQKTSGIQEAIRKGGILLEQKKIKEKQELNRYISKQTKRRPISIGGFTQPQRTNAAQINGINSMIYGTTPKGNNVVNEITGKDRAKASLNKMFGPMKTGQQTSAAYFGSGKAKSIVGKI